MKKTRKRLEGLYEILSSVHTIQAFTNMMDDLLTPQELASITERLSILQALISGKTQRNIAKELKVSIGKITRGSRIVQFGKTDWKKIF